MKVLLVPFLFLAACSIPKEEPCPTTEFNTQEHLAAATLFTQESGEYKALCYQAYNVAIFRLKEELRKSPVKPAVILDLDETVLDNTPYTAWQIKSNNPYTDETWNLWTDLAMAKAVPGAIEFLKQADSLGVSLFYVSNRMRQDAMESTITNLSNLGAPQATAEHLYLKTTTSDKTARRDSVVAAGYTVLLLIGDNLGDFSSRWDKQSNSIRNEAVSAERNKFGNNYIVLPNTLYGTWEGALYNFDWNLTDEQRDSIRKQILRPADI